MMHYKKGENIEKELTKDDLPFDDCWPNGKKDFLWMHVKGGTKLNNVVSYAKNALEKGEHRTIVWSGVGGGVVKTISCAEIIKRTVPLYQVTRMAYTSVEEHWLPQMAGLEEIVANRQIPCLHILMSLDPIDDSVNGLQKPGTKTTFYTDTSVAAPKRNQQKRKQQRYGDGNSGGGDGDNTNTQNGRPQQSRQHNNNDNNRPNRPQKKPHNKPANAEQQSAQAEQAEPNAEATQPTNNRQKRFRHKKRPNQAQQSTNPQAAGMNNNNAAVPATAAATPQHNDNAMAT